MTEEGTLSIVGQPYGYRVCYASNDAYGLERQPATGLDEAGLAALLAACGDAGSRKPDACPLQG
jgi:hypothetical protein